MTRSARGRRPRQPRAHLWVRLFAAFEPDAEDRVVKTKGHAIAAGVEAGRATEAHMRGNDNADRFANQGASQHGPAE